MKSTTHRRRWAWSRLCLLMLSSVVHASFSISAAGSTLKQCSRTDLFWTEQAPIHLWAAPNTEDSPGDPTLHDFGIIDAQYLLWTVNLPVGQKVTFTYVRTSDLTALYSSDEYTVVAGASSSCLVSSSKPSSKPPTSSSKPSVSSSMPSTRSSMWTSTSSAATASGSGPAAASSGLPSFAPSRLPFTSSAALAAASSRTTSSSESVPASSRAPVSSSPTTTHVVWVVVPVIAALIGIATLGAALVMWRRRRTAVDLVVADVLDREPIVEMSGREAEAPSVLATTSTPLDMYSLSRDTSLRSPPTYRDSAGDKSSDGAFCSEVSLPTQMSRDTDAGISFADDGVPDLLPPEYEDRRTHD